MKAEALRNMSADALYEELNSLYRERFNLIMQRGAGSRIKTDLLNKTKLNIARIKTILNEREKGIR